MKQYVLLKEEKFNLKIKKIHYSFKIENTNKPTKFIKIIIHHTGKNKTIQEIINNHVIKNKYTSIGYHFLISKKGTIYESRDLKYAGAHTFGYNKNGIGIALFGNFDEIEPTEKQLESLNKLIIAIKNNYEIKRVLAHNYAIYKQIKEKYWKINLPDMKFEELDSKLKYDMFIQYVTTKILENDAKEENVEIIKKLKSCPGFNMYKYIEKYNM